MATSLSLENDSSLAQGYLKVNGTTAATLTTSGITANLTGNVTGSLTSGGSLTLATEQTASGTAVDFTSIPSWVKRITVMFNGISTNGVSNPLIQVGAGSITTTGYNAGSRDTTVTSVGGGTTYTNGFGIQSVAAVHVLYGNTVINKLSGNTWSSSSTIYLQTGSGYMIVAAGTVTLSGALDRLRITTVNGTDTFDAGTINIMFEG